VAPAPKVNAEVKERDKGAYESADAGGTLDQRLVLFDPELDLA
jgi:hypothetical protein